MKWLVIAVILIVLGRELNIYLCQYRQYTGVFSDVIPFPPSYRSSIGDWLQLTGLISAVYWANWFLFKRSKDVKFY
jgi:hypothetical protein